MRFITIGWNWDITLVWMLGWHLRRMFQYNSEMKGVCSACSVFSESYSTFKVYEVKIAR